MAQCFWIGPESTAAMTVEVRDCADAANFDGIARASTATNQTQVRAGVQLADFGITAGDIAYVYAWGFSVVLFAWLMGYVLGLGLGVIRKV